VFFSVIYCGCDST